MANEEHINILRQGVESWNRWREENPDISPDLSLADLTGINLQAANLGKANFHLAKLGVANLLSANLSDAILSFATLSGSICLLADFHRADLRSAQLGGADLTGAMLHRVCQVKADLSNARLAGAFLSESDLSWANLEGAAFVDTICQDSKLTGCRVYGISAWNVALDGTDQTDLIITKLPEPTIRVDDLEVAQFIYLLLNNEKVRHVIDAVTSKVVLILGRFTEERKDVLDAIREELRRRDLTPLLFDFDKPASKDVTGTVETLARLARFIIADLTDPSSIPHGIATIVPFLRTTPVLPLRLVGSSGYSMFDDLQRAYTWVLKIHEYTDSMSLISTLPEVIAPANDMAEKVRRTP